MLRSFLSLTVNTLPSAYLGVLVTLLTVLDTGWPTLTWAWLN